MYTADEINIIALSGINQLTYPMKRTLLEDFSSAEPDFAKAEKSLIKSLSGGVYNKVKKLFSSSDYRRNVLEELEEKKITCVTYYSKDYPPLLKEIPSPPIVLYCKGDISLLKSDCFTVVGSRRTTPKALSDCAKISGELSHVFTVVTGIADGADSAAIKGALEANGKVISVIANGPDIIYPRTCAQLYERVENEGLLVSEYPPETLPKPFNFPFRNRILAGLSRGTLVVSAGEKSGALITADYSFEYGRDVFAFPYSVGVPSGAGCNSLIKKGAYLTENLLDILKEYGLDFIKPGEGELLTDEELLIYTAVKRLGDAFLPDVAREVKKLPHEIIPVICALQIKKKVVSLGGNRYGAL